MFRLRRFLLIFSALVMSIGHVMAEMVVVVNSRNPVAVLTQQEVINLFFGRLGAFPNGIPAQPIDLVDKHPDRSVFYAQLMGKDLAEVNAYWARLSFSGRQSAPPRVATTEDVIRWVSSSTGGIGFMERSRVDGRLKVVFELR